MKRIRFVLTLLALMYAWVGNAVQKYWRGIDSQNPTLASVDANWEPSGAPTAEDDIVLDADSANRPLTWDVDTGVKSWTQSDYAGTVTFLTGVSASYGSKNYVCYGATQEDGSKAFVVAGDVKLQTGVWTHESTPAMTSTSKNYDLYKKGFGVYRLIVFVGGNCSIGALAKIDVDGKGFAASDGPGYKSDHSASHGGFGGRNYDVHSIVSYIYGSVKEPISHGSGRSTRGGGAVRLAVAGDIIIDGIITSIGPRNGNYPGSGGSVWISASSLSGGGSISVDGGSGTTGAGSAGGGRAAVYLTRKGAQFGDFASRITSNNNNKYGTSGTVYLEKADDNGAGVLVVRSTVSTIDNELNRKSRYRCTPLTVSSAREAPSFSAIKIDGWSNVGVYSGVEMSVGAVDSSSKYNNNLTLYGGRINFTGERDVLLTNMTLSTYDQASAVRVGDSGTNTLYVAENALLSLNSPTELMGSLVVSGSVTHIQVNENSEKEMAELTVTNRIDLMVSGDMEVTAKGEIDVSNKGWTSKTGPGAGVSDGLGAVYAGTVAGSDKLTYGNPLCPFDYGSGGNAASGGGVVKLTIAGTFKLDGMIKAYGSDNLASGGGSGGSVWITASELAPSTGTIDAKGASYSGQATVLGGGGSGGRVSVCQTKGDISKNDWGVTITLQGGKSTGGERSGGGTIYWEKASDGKGKGVLSLSNANSTAWPVLPSSDESSASFLEGVSLIVSQRLRLAGDLTVRDLSIPNESILYLDGHTLTVAGPTQRRVKSLLGLIDAGDNGKIIWMSSGYRLLLK